MHDIVLGIEPSAMRANTACYGHSGARGGESRAEWWALLRAFPATRDRHSQCCNTQFRHGAGAKPDGTGRRDAANGGLAGALAGGVWGLAYSGSPRRAAVAAAVRRCTLCLPRVSKTVQPQRFLPSLTLLPAPGKAGEWNDRRSWLRGRAHIFDRHYCAVESTIWSTLS
jgi:hypothetical protein